MDIFEPTTQLTETAADALDEQQTAEIADALLAWSERFADLHALADKPLIAWQENVWNIAHRVDEFDRKHHGDEPEWRARNQAIRSLRVRIEREEW